VGNTRTLIEAASGAGVKRVVHVSITNPSLDSGLPYFRGKAENEAALRSSRMSWAILRPTVLFGVEDILVNNIAFLLRRFPFFCIAGDGHYRLQPVFIDDLARIAEHAVFSSENQVLDVVGPEIFTFVELVELIGRVIGHPRLLVHVHPRVLMGAGTLLGALLGDVVLTKHEIQGLMASLLVSAEPPLGTTLLSECVMQHRKALGARYASELDRHYV